MATLYFNAAVDSDWNTLGNWWQDEECTVAATSLPTSSDSVVTLLNGIVTGTTGGGAITIANLTIGDDFDLSPTVTGTATINNGYVNGTMTVPVAVFNGGALDYGGQISGSATFNGGSFSRGSVGGNAVFNDTAVNTDGGYVGGDATFNDDSENQGYSTVNGSATFNGSSNNKPSANVNGSAVFNGTSDNAGYVGGDATFNDYSSASETCNGILTVNDYAYIGGSGMASTPTSATFNDFSTHGNAFVHYTVTMNHNSHVQNWGGAYADAFGFNDNSYGGTSSSSTVTINGNPIVIGAISGYSIALDFSRRSGINGSSVLGVI